MKKTLITAAVALLGSTAAMADEPIILKVAHFTAAHRDEPAKVLEPWCAKIEKSRSAA